MNHPEVFTVGNNFRLSQLKEFELDYDHFPLGALVMWEEPRPNTNYTIGVDPSWGVGQDRSAIHVLKNGTVHNKDMQVAEFAADDVNVHELVPICYTLGCLYKNTAEDTEALMSVECNISDDIVQQLWSNYNYSNLFIWKFYDNIKKQLSNKLGWWTTSRTRPKIINKAIHYVKQDWWDISSPWLINEMQTIEKLDNKVRVEAAASHHDDIFMAAAIALWSAHDLEFSELGTIEETAKKRERRLTGIVEAYADVQQAPLSKRRDFINSACSSEDMHNDILDRHRHDAGY